MTQTTCADCQVEFTLRRSDGRFCSRRCGARYQRRTNERTCEVDGCDKPHGARGMCYSHYGSWHRTGLGRTSNGSKFPIDCKWCGISYLSSRREGKYCSDSCKGESFKQIMRTKCALPADHPVMVLAATTIRLQREQREMLKHRSKFAWRTARECPGCACEFTPLYAPNAVCCSQACAARCARRRRRAREHHAIGSWTWSEFMQIARKFDYCCAYCGTKPDRLDPDHVVPLSRGGSDSPSNLLPSCTPCNSSKCAMSLDEWTQWRSARGMDPRQTTWDFNDPRFGHLTDVLLASSLTAA